MLKMFVKTDGGMIAINPDWVVSVKPALNSGQPCTMISGADKQYWYVTDMYESVVRTLNNVI